MTFSVIQIVIFEEYLNNKKHLLKYKKYINNRLQKTLQDF